MQGNFIGTDLRGADARQCGDGVVIDVASNNTIGGTEFGEGNSIAFNRIGVRVAAGTGNGILTNSIYENAGLGIDLGPEGATPNDPADADVGGNNLQNAPVITGLRVVGGDRTIPGGRWVPRQRAPIPTTGSNSSAIPPSTPMASPRAGTSSASSR